MIEFFEEAFDIKTFKEIINSHKNLNLNEIFRLDDIIIEKKYRQK
jgi:hypothetical protein